MNIKKEKSEIFEKLVWARMRFFPYWPAKVVDTPPGMGKIPNKKSCVLFFGTKEFGFVDQDKICDYESNKNKYYPKGRGLAFQTAVKHIEEFKSDPLKFKSHAFVKPRIQKIPIKTEHDVQRRLKNEPVSPHQPIRQENCASSKTNSKQATEKQLLIEKIATLQKENQRIVRSTLDHKTQQQKVEQEHAVKIRSLTSEISTLNTQLKTATFDLAKLKSDTDKTIADLRIENRTYQARLKQLQSSVMEQEKLNPSTSDSDSDSGYEVDKLIGHKRKRDGMHYLVRWKNYSAEHDTWEPADNLDCPEILAKYKKKYDI